MNKPALPGAEGPAGAWGDDTSFSLNMAANKKAAYDFYLVLDFEATCEKSVKINPQEIIEFPVLKVSATTLQTEAEFHKYVSPTVHTQLTAFCTELTGITQEMVDGQPDLQTTLKAFDDWLKANGLLDSGVSFCFVTCGDWDLKTMLPGQCSHFNIPCPKYFCRWINIKQVYTNVTGLRKTEMPGMLRGLGLDLIGRHHSGIDDARNIARILKTLVKQQPYITATGSLKLK